MNHVDTRHFPLEVSFAEIDEYVEFLFAEIAELFVGSEFVERNVVHFVAGE